MQTQQISYRNAICLIMVMILSNTILIGLPSDVGQEAWVTLLLSLLLTIPMALIYARILSLYPGKDLFEIMETLLGKKLGKVFLALYIWYFFQIGCISLQGHSQFIHVVGLPKTPLMVIIAALMMAVLYIVKSGMGTLGKWAGIVTCIILITMVFSFLFSLGIMDVQYFLPVFSHTPQEYLYGSVKTTIVPFLAILIPCGLAHSFRKGDRIYSPYKILLFAILFSVITQLFIFSRILGVLGPESMGDLYYPTFKAAGIIRIGSFSERVESIVSFAYILAGITKAAVCLTSANRGLARLFRVKDERTIAFPFAMLAFAISVILFPSQLSYAGFIDYYRFYAVPFLFLFPLLFWIMAEKKRIKGKSGLSPPSSDPSPHPVL